MEAVPQASADDVVHRELFTMESDQTFEVNPDAASVGAAAIRSLMQHPKPELSVPIPIERGPIFVGDYVYLSSNAKAADVSPPMPGTSSRDMLAPYAGDIGVVVAVGHKRAEVIFGPSNPRFTIKTKYLYRYVSVTPDAVWSSLNTVGARTVLVETVREMVNRGQGCPEHVETVLRGYAMQKQWWKQCGASNVSYAESEDGSVAPDDIPVRFLMLSFSPQNVSCLVSLAQSILSPYAHTRFHLRFAESRHPVGTSTQPTCVHIWGAASILITFDPNCRIAQGESLVFSYDERGTHVINKFTSANLRSKVPFVVPAGKFYVRCTCTTAQSVSWGFRFSAAPHAWKAEVVHAGHVPNVWMASQILAAFGTLACESTQAAGLLLSHLPVDAVSSLLDTALLFILTPKAPLRKDVARSLCMIAQHIDILPPGARFSLPMLKRARLELERVHRKREKDSVLDDEVFLLTVEFFVRIRKFLVADLCVRCFAPNGGDSDNHMYTVVPMDAPAPRTVCYACAQQWRGPDTPRYKAYAAQPCESGLESTTRFAWRDDHMIFLPSTSTGQSVSPSPSPAAASDHEQHVPSTAENPHEYYEHASWIDRAHLLVSILDCFDQRLNLPSMFLAEAWMESRKKVLVRETFHPYSRVDVQGMVHMPGAKSLLVSFDKRSATDPFESVRFSHRDCAHDELGAFSGEDLAYKRLVVNADTFYYSFLSGHYIHETITCDSCGACPLLGRRYKCTICEDYDCCETCFHRKSHDDSHIFLVIRRPAQLNPARIPSLYPDGWKHTPTYKGDVHVGVRCDHCGMKPIRGLRYRCENCHEFNLCERCAGQADAVHDRQHTLLAVTRPLPPENQLPSNNLPYGLLYRKERDTYWGWAFTVSANMTKDEMLRLFSENREELGQMGKAMRDWTAEMDSELVQYANVVCEQGWLNVQPHELNPNPVGAVASLSGSAMMASSSSLHVAAGGGDSLWATRYPRLASVPLDRLRFRFVVLKLLNAKLAPLLHLFLLPGFEHHPTSLGALLSRLRGLVFYDTKADIWNKSITQTHSDKDVCTVYLNRHIIATAANKPERVRMRASLFYQAFSQLQAVNPELLRRKDRAWKVTFVGEGSDDYGGPYRDSLTQIVTELQDGSAPHLLVRTPNGESDAGTMRDKYMPRPSITTHNELEQLRFVGQLIGIALRTKNHVPIDLTPHVWKALVSLSVDRTDLRSVDTFAAQFLDAVRSVDRETFTDLVDTKWVARLADGAEIELIPHGKEKRVTYEDRLVFADLFERARVNEVSAQALAILRGVTQVVPNRWLPLFAPSEVETLVCGAPDIDLDMLKRHTVYEGYNAKSKLVMDFWSVMEEATAEERSLFLRFVSGRARLPLTDAGFDRSMKIQLLDRPRPDDFLPLSHTCFFSIEIPKYSTKEILRSKLMYAIRHCTAIDADFTIGGEAARHMEWNEEDNLESP